MAFRPSQKGPFLGQLQRVSPTAPLVAGVNTARREVYRHLLADGFRTDVLGLAMHRPDEAIDNRPGVYVIDDWRQRPAVARGAGGGDAGAGLQRQNATRKPVSGARSSRYHSGFVATTRKVELAEGERGVERTALGLLVLLALTLARPPLGAAAADPTAGRLGGTRASFEAR